MTVEITGSQRLADPALLRTAAYVDGSWIELGDVGRFGVDNPSTGERIAELPALSAGQTAEAVRAAHRALPGWRGSSAKQRAGVLRGRARSWALPVTSSNLNR